jgi:uncharacterized protein YjbI with pentapeptide repeats
MLAYMHANQYVKLEFKEGWNENMIRTLLYHSFIHSILLGKYVEEVRSLEEKDIKNRIAEEKRLLRLTAALVNLYSEISKSELRVKLLRLGVDESYLNKLSDKEGFLEYFLTSYFYIQEERIEFIHYSFKEYCLAEYYYESIKEGKWWRLNVGMPSKETIDFLKGLVEILKNYKNVKNISISPIIKYDDINILKDNAKRFVESEELLVTDTEIADKEIWKHIKLTKDDYEHLWLYRWISLSMLKWLDPEEEISKEKLSRLIILTSHFIPCYLKNLQKVDLSRTNLSNANLNNADLSGADLSLALLSWANLSSANLSGAKLTNTYLFFANLCGARLTNADLSYANLHDANLSWTKLTNADLSSAMLYKTNLSFADLSGAKLTNAELYFAILSWANLSSADLSGARIINDIDSKGVKVNNETKATNIIVYIKEILNNLEGNLREIILRENPDLKRLYEDNA